VSHHAQPRQNAEAAEGEDEGGQDAVVVVALLKNRARGIQSARKMTKVRRMSTIQLPR
jgi:hypothetical protein